MLETHLCSLLSFSIKIMSFPLANVVLRNKFQIKQILLLDKTVYYYTFHYVIERDRVVNLQSSPTSIGAEMEWVWEDGLSKSARGLFSLN